MTPQQLVVRIRRLQSLTMGLRRECQRINLRDGPATMVEWQEYLHYLRVAATALDAGRVPLASALRRSQGSEK